MINLSRKSRQWLENNTIVIKQTNQLRLYANAKNNKPAIYKFIQKVVKHKHQHKTITYIIDTCIRKICKLYKQPRALVDIRAWAYNNEKWKIPRWHMDGVYFKNQDYTIKKFTAPLLGPGTLILTKKDSIIRNKIKENRKKRISSLDITARRELDNIVDYNHVIQCTVGQGYLHIIGDDKKAHIHSEPNIIGQRLFIAILPASEENIHMIENK
uniref:Uncharacterized protein n=1 Tax=Megaviridae environmental sample TaxID=1737588 RepID=A0A5J6VJH6_9VIRU|nr:MAG: hypothetical protein [Megaviridae environmental sample]